MRISYWSSDVGSSDLLALDLHVVRHAGTRLAITTNHQRLDIGCGAGLGPAAVVDADVTVATEIRNARFGGDAAAAIVLHCGFEHQIADQHRTIIDLQWLRPFALGIERRLDIEQRCAVASALLPGIAAVALREWILHVERGSLHARGDRKSVV